MIVRVIVALMLFSLAITALKVAVAFLFLAGLIFRTRQTIGVIAIFVIIALFTKYPVAAIIVVGVGIIYSLHRLTRSPADDVVEDEVPQLTDETTP